MFLFGAQAWAQPANAAPPLTPAQKVEWDKQRAEGKAAAQRSQWMKAWEAYRIAWTIKQDWKLAANLGRAELQLQRYRDAAEHLSYALREAPPSLATEAPAEWNVLTDMVRNARAKVGAVAITVEPAGAEVRVTGLPAVNAPLPGPVFVDPGYVVVEARAEGFARQSASVKALAGQEASVRLVLVAFEKAAAPRAPVAPRPAAPPAARSTSWRAGVAMLSAGGASLLAGVVTGVVFVGKHSELVAACPDDVCPKGFEPTLRTRYALGMASTITLIGGGLLAATGAVLVGVAPRAQRHPAAWVGPMVGVGLLGAQGRF